MYWQWSVCVLYTLRCISDRSWDFLVPIAIANAFPDTLLPASAVEAAQTVGRLVLAPKVALWYAGQTSQRPAYLKLLFVELVNISLYGCMLVLVAQHLLQDQHTYVQCAFLFLACIVAAMEAGFKVVLVTVVSKNWAAELSESDIELTHANSRVTLCNLAAAAATPLIVSCISTALGHAGTAAVLICWQALAAALITICSRGLGAKLSALGASEGEKQGGGGGRHDIESNDSNSTQNPPSEELSLMGVLREWSKLPIEVRGAMLALVVLFCTVISESSTPWIATQVSDTTVAAWRSSMQVVGFLGAASAPFGIQYLGLLRAARLGQGFQSCCVTVALVSMLTGNTMPYLVAVATTRIGLWWFMLAEQQMVQRAAPIMYLAPLFATEGSAQQCAHLVMLLVNMVYSKPSQFFISVIISACATYTATLILNLAACFRSKNQGKDCPGVCDQQPDQHEGGKSRNQRSDQDEEGTSSCESDETLALPEREKDDVDGKMGSEVYI